VQREEQQLPGPAAQPAADPDGEVEQTAQRTADRSRRAGHLALDAGEHGLVQARHGNHDGAAVVLQSTHDLRPGDARRQDHRSADCERCEQADGQRIGVVQRQRQQHPVIGLGQIRRLERAQVGAQIAVGKRDTFGRAGRARGVQQYGRLIGGQLGQLMRLLAQQRGPRARVAALEIRRHLVIEQDQLPHPVEGRRARREWCGGDQRPAAAVLEHPFELMFAHLLVERHRERPAAYDAEQGDHPFRSARREQADHLFGLHAEAGEAGGEAQGVPPQPVARPGPGVPGDDGRPLAAGRQLLDQILKGVQHARFRLPRPVRHSPPCLAKDEMADHR
jgi:hypothetical protein